MEGTASFLKRYQQHIQTPGFGVPGQEALLKSKMLVVGAGSLASPVLSYLASMGIGFIGIVADETIRKEDLPAQPFYFSNDEGKPMAKIAARQLREINPDINITLYEKVLDTANIVSIIAQYDLIIDCGNDLRKSYLINDACVITGKPMVYGALFHPKGYVSVFNYKGSGTLRCMLAQPEIAQLYQQEPIPGLAVLAAITGSLMVNEAIKIISEIGTVLQNKLLTINSFNNQQELISFSPIPANQTLTSLHDSYANYSDFKFQPSTLRAITPKLLQLKMKYNETLQLIDIRSNVNNESTNWNFLHITENELLERSAVIHQDIMVILISETGESAKRLCSILNQQYGFDNIYYLEGGFEQWQKETNSSTIIYESF